MPGGTRLEQAASTRTRLVKLARELFAEGGYAGTPIGAILDRAGLARGALYHHFGSKEQLFCAVARQVEDEVLAWMSPAGQISGGPWAALRAACGLYVSACSDPGVKRILLRDAPAVGGETGGGARRSAVLSQRLSPALDGDLDRAAALAPLLLGALGAAVLRVGDSREQETWIELHHAVTSLLEGLRLVQQQGVIPSLPGRATWEEEPWQAWRRRAAPTSRS